MKLDIKSAEIREKEILYLEINLLLVGDFRNNLFQISDQVIYFITVLQDGLSLYISKMNVRLSSADKSIYENLKAAFFTPSTQIKTREHSSITIVFSLDCPGIGSFHLDHHG